jgi:hypothetical protein
LGSSGVLTLNSLFLQVDVGFLSPLSYKLKRLAPPTHYPAEKSTDYFSLLLSFC